jgi:hypothetical protein
LALLICVFIAGVLFGIWLDWSAPKKNAPREIAYQLEDYQTANLRVHAGDTIYLVTPPGGNATGPDMSFVGNNIPCVDQKTPGKCVISASAPPGGYYFNCTSSNGYVCPDPGIQPSTTQPLDSSYAGTVKTDFVNFVGLPVAPKEKPEKEQPATPRLATSTIAAIVGCSGPPNSNTTVTFHNGNPAYSMPVTKGGSVFWISPPAFSISNLPANFCKNGNPNGNITSGKAECDIDPNYSGNNTVAYTVQQSQCGPTAVATPTTLQL